MSLRFLGLLAVCSIAAMHAADPMPLGTSARGTRVDWQGVFKAEASPTGEEETDRSPVQTEVDVFSMMPTYSTADITLPMRGGELSVDFRRRCNPFTYNLRCLAGGAPPAASPVELVLGPGWSTNLAARVVHVMESQPGGGYSPVVHVYDEDGAEYTYYAATAGTTTMVPKLLNSFDNRSLSVTLKPNHALGGPPDYYTLIKPHGVVLKFVKTDAIRFNGLMVGGGVYPVLDYYRIESIADRNGNQINYQYDIVDNADPVLVTKLGHSAGAKGPNGSHLPTRIYDAKNTGRKIDFVYGYDAGWDMNVPYILWNRPEVLKIQNLGFPYRSPWRLLKATASGGIAFDYVYTAPNPTGAIPVGSSIASPGDVLPYVRGTLIAVDMPQVPVDNGTGTTLARPRVEFDYDVQVANDKQQYVDASGLTYLFPGEQLIGGVHYSPYEGLNVFTSLKKVRDPRGYETRLTYQVQGRPVSSNSAAAYMPGLPVSYWIQARPVVQTIVTPYMDAAGVLQQAAAVFSIDAWSNVMQQSTVSDVRGNITTFRFDFEFKTTSGANNGFGAYQASKLTRSQGGKTVIHEYAADVNGNLIKVTDMNGVVTQYAYTSGIAGDAFDQPVDGGRPYDSFLNPRRYQLYNKPYSRNVDGTSLTTYRYTTVNSTATAGSSANLLSEKNDPSGIKTSYTFDARGNRLTESVSNGGLTSTTNYVYDGGAATGEGEVTQIRDPDQRVTDITLAWDSATLRSTRTTKSSGYLGTPFTTLESFSTIEVSDVFGRLLSRTSPKSAVTTWTYDALGRQATEVLPTPTSTAYRFYDLAGHLTRDLDHVGNCTLTTYDPRGNPLIIRRRMNSPTANDNAKDLVTTKVWDAAGLLLSETDPLGRQTQYGYDALLRLSSKTLPPVVLVTGQPAQTFTETYEYGTRAGAGTWTIRSGWNPTRVTGADGVVTDSAFDSFYRRTQQVQRVGAPPTDHATAPRAGEPASITTYNAAHQPTSITQYTEVWNGTALAADTRVSYIYYDALQRKTLEALDLDGGTVPLAVGTTVADGLNQGLTGSVRATRYAYDLAGHVTSTKDAVGALTQTTYDGAGRPSVVTQQSVKQFLTRTTGTTTTEITASPTTRNTYDKHLLWKVEDPHGTVTQFTYDARDRRTTTVVDLNADGTFSTAYNGADRVEVTAYDLMGNVTRSTDSRGNATDIVYDRAYRKLTVQQPSVSNAEPVPAVAARPLTTTAYDLAGNAILVTDARNVQTQTTFDAWNRPITVVQALGTPVAVTTETRYDTRGNVLTLTLKNDAGSGGDQTTTYEYDGLHRKTKEILPTVDASTRQTLWAYTRNGEAYQQTDAKLQVVRTIFSRAGQPLTVTFLTAAGGTVTETRTFTYDLAGRPLTVADGAGSTIYTYDLLGRQTSESRTNTGESTPTIVTSRYDAVGNRTWVDYPGAPVPYALFTVYDRANRATSVIETAAGTTKGTTGYTYDANGNRLSQTNANGTVTTWTYDALNRNLLSETKNGATVLVSTLFAYDLVGNRLTMVEKTPQMPNRTVTYTYDAQYRLTGESWQ